MAALHATAVADNTHLEMTVAARDKVAQRSTCMHVVPCDSETISALRAQFVLELEAEAPGSARARLGDRCCRVLTFAARSGLRSAGTSPRRTTTSASVLSGGPRTGHQSPSWRPPQSNRIRSASRLPSGRSLNALEAQEPVRGELPVASRGLLVITWDNTASRMRSKQLRYIASADMAATPRAVGVDGLPALVKEDDLVALTKTAVPIR